MTEPAKKLMGINRLLNLFVGAFVLLFIGSCVWDVFDVAWRKPSPGVTNIKEFAAKMPAPKRLFVQQLGSKKYIVWIGPNTMTIWASGPPGYIFESNGKLLDWSTDIGDDHHLEKFYQGSWPSTMLTVEAALAEAQNPGTQPSTK